MIADGPAYLTSGFLATTAFLAAVVAEVLAYLRKMDR